MMVPCGPGYEGYEGGGYLVPGSETPISAETFKADPSPAEEE
jgi:hypothetical protein